MKQSTWVIVFWLNFALLIASLGLLATSNFDRANFGSLIFGLSGFVIGAWTSGYLSGTTIESYGFITK